MVVFPLVPVTTMVSLGFATYRKKSPYSRIAAMPGLSLRTCPVRQYQNRKNLPPHRAMANPGANAIFSCLPVSLSSFFLWVDEKHFRLRSAHVVPYMDRRDAKKQKSFL